MNKRWLALVAVLSACQLNPTGGDSATRRLGTIRFYADPVRIEAPGSVQAGVPFTVRVTSYGGGCVTQGDTEAGVTGSEARVTVYDRFADPGPNGACTMELRLFEHTATLQLTQPGAATLLVRGWAEPGEEEVTVTRQVVVQ